MSFDAISYLLAKKALSRGIIIPTLKDLVIDISKDWQGYRIRNLGEPIEPYDAARRFYVDEATTGLGINYYLLDAADSEVSIYKQLSLTPPELSEAYIETAQNSAGDYEIGSWIAPADSIPILRLGVYTMHFQAERVSGNINVRFFFRLYERDSGGSETLIAESSLSDLVIERRNVITSLILASDYEMSEGSRLVLKLYARYLSSGSSTTMRLYYQGDVRSRFAVPTAKEILDTIYASITHASRHASGGADPISGLTYDQLASDTIVVDAHFPVPDSHQSGLAADSTGVKWTSVFKGKWNKRHLKKVRIRATWSASATDSVTKIAVKDSNTGYDIASVSGNAGTDSEAEATDLTNVTDGGLFEVYAEVTTASATSGATFDIGYVVVELVYGVS